MHYICLFSKTNIYKCSYQSSAAYRHLSIISNRTYAKRLLHPWMESEVDRELLLAEMSAKKKTEEKETLTIYETPCCLFAGEVYVVNTGS